MNKSAALLGFFFSIGLARAVTVTTTFNVTATVTNACTVSATPLAFGNYDVINSLPVLGTSTINVLCTIGGIYSVRLNAGVNGASVNDRRMSNGVSSTLGYGLFRDASRTLNWGETDGTDTVSGVGTGTTQGYTVYGRIPPNQNVPAGAYSDTVTVTVLF